MFDKLEENGDYKGMRAAQAKAKEDGRLIGIGVGGSGEASG